VIGENYKKNDIVIGENYEVNFCTTT